MPGMCLWFDFEVVLRAFGVLDLICGLAYDVCCCFAVWSALAVFSRLIWVSCVGCYVWYLGLIGWCLRLVFVSLCVLWF